MNADERMVWLSVMGLVVVYYSLDFYSGVSEVEYEAEVGAGCFQVVHALGQVDALDTAHGFQFDYDEPLYQQVGAVVAYHNAIVVDRDLLLLLHEETSFPQLMNERVFVDFLQKAGPQSIANLKSRPDDLLAYSIQIRVHLRSSVA